MTTSARPKIRIEHLIKIYGSKPQAALQLFRSGTSRDDILEKTGQVLGIADISLDVNPGEIFVVMGLSGSGKSTLVRCINRLIEPTMGHIYIDDVNVTRADAKQLRQIRLKQISMVFQRFGLLPHKSVAENVEYGLKVGGVGKRQRRQKALDTLETVGLVQWADYRPASLSGGMQQRVGLARALATDAEILLMDEPFSALDPLIRRDMQGELLRLQRELNKTIVFISHDIQEALRIGDRIAVMKDGYIVQVGTPEDLVTRPADDYIRAFIQDINRAQVLKTGTVARQTIPFILGQDSAKAAFSQMRQLHLPQMYVLDHDGRPAGILHRTALKAALKEGDVDINQVMQTDFPQVNAATRLESIFHICGAGAAVAVVDDIGKFQGVIESSDILARIGRLSLSTKAFGQDDPLPRIDQM